MIKAVVVDVEGTTSSLSFVKDVLFPYAAEHIADFVRDKRTEKPVREQLDAVAELSGLPSHDPKPLIEQLVAWIDEDVKATPLKALQGMIWKRGYESGAYRAHVYADAVRSMRDWFEAGIELYVYSSGSVQAQQLFFEHSRYGDLRPLFRGYFDTTTGMKQETGSYLAIASAIDQPAEAILFLSDVEAELDAARAAGWQTARLLREEDYPDAKGVESAHPLFASFDDISPKELP